LLKLNITDKTTMRETTTKQFNCQNCNALYHLIKVEAGPETIDRKLNCQACGAPLPARDGQFVLPLAETEPAQEEVAAINAWGGVSQRFAEPPERQ
jgi:hypothetical protein